MENIKKLKDFPTLEQLQKNIEVLVNENGVAKKITVEKFGISLAMTEQDAIDLLVELDIVRPITATNGDIYVSNTEVVYIL